MNRTTNTMRSLGLFTIAALGLLAVAACSAAPLDSKLDTGCTEANPCTTTKKEAKAPKDNSPLEPTPPAPAAPTPPAASDAGADAARTPPPGETTHYCADLTGCCNTLASTVEKYSCIAIAIANKETPCRAELAICSVGGIGGTPCSNLNKCCDQMQAEGYSKDAADCRGHNTGNASTCSGWLSQYRNDAWCN